MRNAFNRYSIARRVVQEIRYAAQVGRRIAEDAPDMVIFSNVPLLAHRLLTARLRRRKIPMVFWQQDIYSSAIGATARQKLGSLGGVLAWAAERLERSIARRQRRRGGHLAHLPRQALGVGRGRQDHRDPQLGPSRGASDARAAKSVEPCDGVVLGTR